MFSQKAYVFFSMIAIALISFFSVGLPYRESGLSFYPRQGLLQTSGIVIKQPLLLSFPLYASIENRTYFGPAASVETSAEFYRIEFLALLILHTLICQETTYISNRQSITHFNVDWGDYLLYCAFFMLVNVAGIVAGYWISKSTLANRLFRGDVASTNQRVNVIIGKSLEKMSLKLVVTSFVLLTAVDIVQTIMAFPEYEVGIIANAFMVFLGNWA